MLIFGLKIPNALPQANINRPDREKTAGGYFTETTQLDRQI